MLGINLEVIVILSCPLQLQEEHKDPLIPDQDNYSIQESLENKSCSKWLIRMLGIILKVIVILSCPLQLQQEHRDPLIPDKDNYMVEDNHMQRLCSKDTVC